MNQVAFSGTFTPMHNFNTYVDRVMSNDLAGLEAREPEMYKKAYTELKDLIETGSDKVRLTIKKTRDKFDKTSSYRCKFNVFFTQKGLSISDRIGEFSFFKKGHTPTISKSTLLRQDMETILVKVKQEMGIAN